MSDRREEFIKEFVDLLRKYKAELHITDDNRPYGMHSAIARLSFEDPYEEHDFPLFLHGGE